MPADPSKTAFAVPQDTLDKVIFSKVETLTVQDSVSGKSFILSHIPYQCIPIVIFSYDGGLTWRDHSTNLGLTGYSLAPPVTVQANTNTDGSLSLTVYQNALINGGSPFQLILKIAYLAPDNLQYIDSERTSFSGGTAYSSLKKYLRVKKRGTVTNAPGISSSSTIPHGLGYVPFAAYNLDASSQVFTPFGNSSAFGPQNSLMYVDTNNGYIYTDYGGSSVNALYRIYEEAV